jgi:hypothetical protein
VPGAKYAWLLELKYLPANAKPAQIVAALADAAAQVERYASDSDLLPMLLGNRELKAGLLVFPGTKKPHFRPWPMAPGPAAKAPRKTRRAMKKPPSAAKAPRKAPRTMKKSPSAATPPRRAGRTTKKKSNSSGRVARRSA